MSILSEFYDTTIAKRRTITMKYQGEGYESSDTKRRIVTLNNAMASVEAWSIANLPATRIKLCQIN